MSDTCVGCMLSGDEEDFSELFAEDDLLGAVSADFPLDVLDGEDLDDLLAEELILARRRRRD